MPRDQEDSWDAREDRIPIPDPTRLTTEALRREIAGLRELLEQRIESEVTGIRELFQQRIDSTNELCNEKFFRVDRQFGLVENQRVEQKRDTRDAVDAALAAAKASVREQTDASDKAISKSEKAVHEQLVGLSNTFNTATEDMRRSINEVKERIGVVDAKANGIVQQKVGAKEDRSGIYAALAAVGGLIILGMSVIGFLAARGGP